MYLCLLCLALLRVFAVDFVVQAEDGIRDLVRSRGLGDVYKRQRGNRPGERPGRAARAIVRRSRAVKMSSVPYPQVAVSYTHLTLPTIYSV